jgi:hypothetical protein
LEIQIIRRTRKKPAENQNFSGCFEFSAENFDLQPEIEKICGKTETPADFLNLQQKS